MNVSNASQLAFGAISKEDGEISRAGNPRVEARIRGLVNPDLRPRAEGVNGVNSVPLLQANGRDGLRSGSGKRPCFAHKSKW